MSAKTHLQSAVLPTLRYLYYSHGSKNAPIWFKNHDFELSWLSMGISAKKTAFLAAKGREIGKKGKYGPNIDVPVLGNFVFCGGFCFG